MEDHKTRTTTFFNALNKNTLHLVREFYSSDIHFCDPLGEHRGVAAVEHYYRSLYQNVTSIRFEFGDLNASAQEGNSLAAPWTMHLTASKLNRGRPIALPGLSLIRFDPSSNQATYHRDYFDMGAFIYEHVPVLGSVIRFVNARLRS